MLDKLVRRLVLELDPQTIILYGSYAYGEPGDDSDIATLAAIDARRDWWRFT